MQTPVSLLHRIQTGGSDTDWTRFCQIYYPLVLQWARRSSSSLEQDEAMDVVQEVFLDVHRNICHFQRQGAGALRGWFRTILRSKLTDLRRKRFPEVVDFTESHEALRACITDSDGLGRQYQEILEKACAITKVDFAENTWEAFHRTQILGEDPEQVGKAMGLTRNAVYVARFRVMRRFEEVLGNLLD